MAVVRRVNEPDPDYRIRRMDFNLIGLEVRHSCDRVSELRSCRLIRQDMLFRRFLGFNCGNISDRDDPDGKRCDDEPLQHFDLAP